MSRFSTARARAEVRTRVTVTEEDHRLWLISGGYGSEEKIRGDVEWRHANFLGDARTLSLHGKWSSLDNGAEGTFIQPELFAPGISLSLNGRAWFVDEPAFKTLTRGGRATLARALGPYSNVSLTVTHEFQRSEIANEALTDLTLRDELIALGLNPTTGVQDGALTSIGVAAAWQNTESVLDPRRGLGVSLNVEQAGGWLPGTYNYLGTIGESRAYLTPIAPITVAGRVRYGTMMPFDAPSDVPFFKRFFLGGAGSLRGWGRFEVAPLSGSGLPLGGNSLFEVSAEIRTRPFNRLGIVAFLDAGNVWSDAWTLRPSDLLYDAGPGVRYETPIGLIRLDVAYQLNRLEGLRIGGELQDRPWRIHFSIGQTF
jgi:outer membrane translocation and assembly module TamA